MPTTTLYIESFAKQSYNECGPLVFIVSNERFIEDCDKIDEMVVKNIAEKIKHFDIKAIHKTGPSEFSAILNTE